MVFGMSPPQLPSGKDSWRDALNGCGGGAQRFGHVFDLLVGEFREHRQRKAVAHHVFGDRKIAGPMAEMLVGRLERHGRRIVDGGGDAGVGKLLLQVCPIHVFDQHDEQMPDVRHRIVDCGQADSRRVGQQFPIMLGVTAPGRVP